MSQPPKLLADRMLGKLARILRMTGQDVEYVREGDPHDIAARAAAEGRVLLSRDTRLVEQLPSALYVESNYPFHQARQVIRELALVLDPSFRRCVEDNGPLEMVPKESVRSEVPHYVFDSRDEFMRCQRCGRVFWAGTHLDGMRRLIASLEDAPLVLGDREGKVEEGAVHTLEPLVDLHQAMEVLLLEHRLALMRADPSEALKNFRRFAIWMRRHIQDESELILPVYRDLGPHPRGATAEIFEHDHQKILEHLDRTAAAAEALRAQEKAGEPLRVACLALLDRERTLVDLCEHHDRRERAFLYPTLERALEEPAMADLLVRMVGHLGPG
jgi:uncharacterized protein with PIN domain